MKIKFTSFCLVLFMMFTCFIVDVIACEENIVYQQENNNPLYP